MTWCYGEAAKQYREMFDFWSLTFDRKEMQLKWWKHFLKLYNMASETGHPKSKQNRHFAAFPNRNMGAIGREIIHFWVPYITINNPWKTTPPLRLYFLSSSPFSWLRPSVIQMPSSISLERFQSIFIHVAYTFPWWFEICFIFSPTWGNDPIWLICCKWVGTTT